MIEKYLRAKVCELLPALAGRVYPQSAPEQTVPPYGVYACVGTTYNGTLKCGCGVNSETMQFDIYTASYKEAKNYADTLREALTDFSGDLSGYPVGYIKIVNIIDGYEPEVDDQKVTLEFEIFY